MHAILATPQASTLPALAVHSPTSPAAVEPSQVPALRQQAVAVLAAAVGGDLLAAEYLLLQLVSR